MALPDFPGNPDPAYLWVGFFLLSLFYSLFLSLPFFFTDKT